ncbi:MAG: ATP-binding protein [Bryobacterales bacterium]|nr:ATP-binding protein [Bryobacterales bacterium]
MTVLFGPNSAGKSNLLDAVQALSRVGTERTLMDALESSMIRGSAFELFALPPSGIIDLDVTSKARFLIESDLVIPKEQSRRRALYRYRVEVEVRYGSGALTNCGEYLAALKKSGDPWGVPAIEETDDKLVIRRQRGSGRPRTEATGLNYTILSDARLASPIYKYIERTRKELQDWRSYYVDPRIAMRSDRPPMDVRDIGIVGQNTVPFLYKLKGQMPNHFAAILRTLRTIIPSISSIDVNLDRRGILNFSLRQDGATLSSRIVSDGTLRLLALCAICVNPWNGSLVALEEPENGVHPRRVALIAKMLTSLALDQRRQVIVTSHSPLFCDAVLKEARSRSTDEVGLFIVRRNGTGTEVEQFHDQGPLFSDPEIAEALSMPIEDHIFESLVLTGAIDE